MAEVQPPRHDVHPMRVIFMITREPSPVLDIRGHWSLAFHDFVAQCLRKEARGRPTATELLPHRFLHSSAGSGASLVPMILAAQASLREGRGGEGGGGGEGEADAAKPAAAVHPQQERSRQDGGFGKDGGAGKGNGSGASPGDTESDAESVSDTGSVIVKDTAPPPPPSIVRGMSRDGNGGV